MPKKQLFKSRGTSTAWDDQTISFMPQAEGKPAQDVLKQPRTSKLYATTNVNKPKIIVNLTLVKNSQEDFSDLYQQLDEQRLRCRTRRRTRKILTGRRPQAVVLYSSAPASFSANFFSTCCKIFPDSLGGSGNVLYLCTRSVSAVYAMAKTTETTYDNNDN